MAKKEAEKKEESKEAPAVKRVPRKQLPSVAYLLANGDPETAHLPKTFKDKYGFPIAVCIVFCISLMTFIYAPHSKSVHKGFKLPTRNRPPLNLVKVVKDPETEILKETVTVTKDPEPEVVGGAEPGAETTPEAEL